LLSFLPTGTFTLQDTPSLPRRDNVMRQPRAKLVGLNAFVRSSLFYIFLKISVIILVRTNHYKL
jgi:hypothetical protein